MLRPSGIINLVFKKIDKITYLCVGMHDLDKRFRNRGSVT